MGIQLGAQRRAGLLLGCRDVQEQVPGAAPSPWGGDSRESHLRLQHTPAPGLAACSCLWPALIPRTASCRCWQLPLEAPPVPSWAKAPATQIFAFCHPSHHFPLLLPFKSTFCAALVLPGTPWAPVRFGCQSCPLVSTGAEQVAPGAGVGSSRAWKESSLLALCFFSSVGLLIS